MQDLSKDLQVILNKVHQHIEEINLSSEALLDTIKQFTEGPEALQLKALLDFKKYITAREKVIMDNIRRLHSLKKFGNLLEQGLAPVYDKIAEGQYLFQTIINKKIEENLDIAKDLVYKITEGEVGEKKREIEMAPMKQGDLPKSKWHKLGETLHLLDTYIPLLILDASTRSNYETQTVSIKVSLNQNMGILPEQIPGLESSPPLNINSLYVPLSHATTPTSDVKNASYMKLEELKNKIKSLNSIKDITKKLSERSISNDDYMETSEKIFAEQERAESMLKSIKTIAHLAENQAFIQDAEKLLAEVQQYNKLTLSKVEAHLKTKADTKKTSKTGTSIAFFNNTTKVQIDIAKFNITMALQKTSELLKQPNFQKNKEEIEKQLQTVTTSVNFIKEKLRLQPESLSQQTKIIRNEIAEALTQARLFSLELKDKMTSAESTPTENTTITST